MNYQFAVDNENYEDLSSGRVLFNQHGTTGFPVRLASEIFQRSKFLLSKKGNAGPYKVYDPCCGGAYLLTTLGFLHNEDLDTITASDIDSRAVELAGKNLSLLSTDGMDDRIDQLNKLYREYGKESHKDALESADRLNKIVRKSRTRILINCFEADITKDSAVINQRFDLIITDLPYGQIVGWQTDTSDPVTKLLDNVSSCLDVSSLVVMVSTKEVKIQHENYIRLGSYKLGKRKITFLEKSC